MSLFEPVIGNLPLLRLPPAKLTKLSGQALWDCREQLQHNCIRQAWAEAVRSDYNVRDLLDLRVSRASLTFAKPRGQEPVERFLNMDMESARRENELRTCFGFFLEGEFQHILREKCAGPILRSVLPPDMHSLGVFRYAGLLENLLSHYRERVSKDPLARETVSIVRGITRKDPWLDSVPSQIKAYFELAHLADEAIEAECQRRGNPA